MSSAAHLARRSVLLLLRLSLGALFVYAGAMKLRDPGAFAVEIANYHLLPDLAPWLAVTLPSTEVVAGVSLCLAPGPWLRAAALLVGALSAVFTVAVAQVVARGINISCGCFGGDSGPVTLVTVGRDLAFLVAAALVYRLAAPAKPAPQRA